MTDEVISFFNCAAVPQGSQLVIPARIPEEQMVFSVSPDMSDWSDWSGTTAGYQYMYQAARRITRWITVTAECFRSAVTRRIRAFVRNAVCTSGVQILRKIAILRF